MTKDTKDMDQKLKINKELGAGLSQDAQEKIEAFLKEKQEAKDLKAQKKKERYWRSSRDI